ncbi:MAG: hypothetical protein AB3X44_01210 [Leptothrix sp. (in: b-proteobacteria)]
MKDRLDALRRLVGFGSAAEPAVDNINRLGDRIASVAVQTQQQHELLMAQLETQYNQLSNQLKQHSEELVAAKRHFDSAIKKETLNATRQVEAFINLQALWNETDILPPMHGWPVSPDLAVMLIELMEAEQYDLIIEFGSGSSTLLMARLLRRLKKCQNQSDVIPELLTFEHLPEYHGKTQSLLQRSGVSEFVNLNLSPLIVYKNVDGGEYKYYDCDAALCVASQKINNPGAKILLFVDGPPAGTGPLARYPALPMVMKYFKTHELHVLLDDYIRQDEKDIAKAWQENMKQADRRYIHTEVALEKGASLLRIARC